MPALYQYDDGREGSHGVTLCRAGQTANVPIDQANGYITQGWVQCAIPSPITTSMSQSKTSPPHLPAVGGSGEILLALAISLILTKMLACAKVKR